MKFTKFSVILSSLSFKKWNVYIRWVLLMTVESKYLLFLFSYNVWIHGATKQNSDTCVMHSESSFSRPGTIKLLEWRKKIEKYLTFLVCIVYASCYWWTTLPPWEHVVVEQREKNIVLHSKRVWAQVMNSIEQEVEIHRAAQYRYINWIVHILLLFSSHRFMVTAKYN